MRTPLLYPVIGLAAIALYCSGCEDEFDLPNAPAQVEAAGNITPPVEGCQLEAPPQADAGSGDVGGDDAGAGDAGETDAGAGDAGLGDAGNGDAGQDDGEPSGFRVRLSRVDDLISIPYLVRDREGDDQQIRVEICEWDGEQPNACGTAVQGPGGDGTAFVSTAPAGSCALHVFHWNVGCGRFIGRNGGSPQRTILEDVDQQLVARVSVIGADTPPAVTEPFALSDEELGFNAVPECN